MKHQPTSNTRRDFIRLGGAGLATIAAWPDARAEQTNLANPAGLTKMAEGSGPGPICLFSKHLPMLDWKELAAATRAAGFDGIDLTVRPGGHVLPERAATDLPLAVQTIRESGLSVPMITTGLVAASEPTAVPIISTAGQLGIPFYKTGYYKYRYANPRAEMTAAVAQFATLATLGARHRIVAGFHNHCGNIGGAIADVAPAIEKLDRQWAGYYFDVRHAVCEGGAEGWRLAFHLAAPQMKMIAVKDFYWERGPQRADGSPAWRQVNCPLGEGMVDWKLFTRLLREAAWKGPVSLHLEYPIPGKTDAEKRDNTLVAARRDLAFLKARLAEAWS